MAALPIVWGWLLAGTGVALAFGRLVGRPDDEGGSEAEDDAAPP